MADGGELIFVGAEAEVRRGAFLGHATVRKSRRPKAYRHPELDEAIRRERTRQEALLTAEARRGGVAVPYVLDVDMQGSSIELEAVDGPQLRAVLESEGRDRLDLCVEFGRLVGRLHAAGLVHGDLTTSNVIVRGGGLVLIDFGLAQRSDEVEDRGVDLHLVERTFESSHPGEAGACFRSFVGGYQGTFKGAEQVLRRMDQIKGRARYA